MAVERIQVEGLARLPAFSHATKAGGFVYVSGTLGTEPDTLKLVEGRWFAQGVRRGCGKAKADAEGLLGRDEVLDRRQVAPQPGQDFRPVVPRMDVRAVGQVARVSGALLNLHDRLCRSLSQAMESATCPSLISWTSTPTPTLAIATTTTTPWACAPASSPSP